jgi:hypothetical protein
LILLECGLELTALKQEKAEIEPGSEQRLRPGQRPAKRLGGDAALAQMTPRLFQAS